MNISRRMKPFLVASFAVAAAFLVLPVPASAARVVTACSATLEADSLTVAGSRATISGTASSTKSVQVVLKKEGSKKTLYKSGSVRVRNGEWSLRIPKKLAGEYDVSVYCPRVSRGTLAVEGELVAGEATKKAKEKSGSSSSAKAGTSVSVSSLAMLLGGGTTGAGQDVPVSYLKVVNTGKGDVTITGFKMKQAGSASASAISGYTVVDGDVRTYTEGTTAKLSAKLAPGEVRLFTVRAKLANSLSANLGKDLKVEVAGIEGAADIKGSFPIKGTTWVLR